MFAAEYLDGEVVSILLKAEADPAASDDVSAVRGAVARIWQHELAGCVAGPDVPVGSAQCHPFRCVSGVCPPCTDAQRGRQVIDFVASGAKRGAEPALKVLQALVEAGADINRRDAVSEQCLRGRA